jgi:hypothetical protein
MFVEWIRGIDRIEDLRERWQELEAQLEQPALCGRYDFAIPWYHAYAGDPPYGWGDPLVGLIWDGSELVGVAPLITSRGSFSKVPVHRADCAGHNHDAGELLLRPGEAGAYEKVVDSLRNELGYDLVALNGLDIRGATYDRLRGHVAIQGVHNDYLNGPSGGVANLSSGYQAYVDARGSVFCAQVADAARRIQAEGTWHIDRLCPGEQSTAHAGMRDRMMSIIESNRRASTGATGRGQNHAQFYNELAKVWGRRDAIDLSIIRVAGRDAGFCLAIVDREVCYVMTHASAQEFRNLAPDLHLLQEVFKTLPERGIRKVIAPCAGGHAVTWATEMIPRYTVCIFGKSYMAALAYFMGFKARFRGHGTGSEDAM